MAKAIMGRTVHNRPPRPLSCKMITRTSTDTVVVVDSMTTTAYTKDQAPHRCIQLGPKTAQEDFHKEAKSGHSQAIGWAERHRQLT